MLHIESPRSASENLRVPVVGKTLPGIFSYRLNLISEQQWKEIITNFRETLASGDRSGRLCFAATKETLTLHVTIQVSVGDMLGVVRSKQWREKGELTSSNSFLFSIDVAQKLYRYKAEIDAGIGSKSVTVINLPLLSSSPSTVKATFCNALANE